MTVRIRVNIVVGLSIQMGFQFAYTSLADQENTILLNNYNTPIIINYTLSYNV